MDVRLLKIEEVARITGEHLQTVYRRVREGEIVSIKVGKRGLRISEKTLTDWLASQQAGGR